MTLRTADLVLLVLRAVTALVLLSFGALAGTLLVASVLGIPAALEDYDREPEDLLLLILYLPFLVVFAATFGGGALYVWSDGKPERPLLVYAALGLLLASLLSPVVAMVVSLAFGI